MYTPQRVRQGWVKISRRPNGKFLFSGIAVIGRDRQGGMTNRLLWAHHSCPAWFMELCDEYADTNFKVEMKVVKMHHIGVALCEPIATSKEIAIRDYQVRYGLLPNPNPDKPIPTPDDHQVPQSAYRWAWQTHEYAANLLGMDIVENIEEGLMSYSRAVDRKTGKPLTIIGGMLVNKVIKGFKPEDEQWQRTVRAFVRVKEVR